ncbi:uncharacterized protein BXZ73DRAFT_87256 [Epithele typhae]|uniref:uncharacterized protein n=1 Tax=Epithele typhae TaxID=378194 RepID=UPI0020084C63|nr:uncharacterized protein BXZ73DRAFT_87256 [Epithele typhae]KAH9944315.1 hypothetical protein BXZ73DRAFT_87256 [Epithele typhae]
MARHSGPTRLPMPNLPPTQSATHPTAVPASSILPDSRSHFLPTIYEDADWTLGEFLYHTFLSGDNVHREQSHAQRVSRFLKGQDRVYTPGSILDLWMRHPDGALRHTLPEDRKTAASVRVALTRFSAELVRKHLIGEAERAVQPENGLHATRKVRRNGPTGQKTAVEWADIGATTLSLASDIIQYHQLLLWDLLSSVATREKDSENQDGHEVVTNVIINLDFSRSSHANLVPISRTLHLFALSTPYDAYPYLSRIGMTTAYSTGLHVLNTLADTESHAVRELGAQVGTPICIIMDNRDACVGRANGIVIGIAATFVENPHISLSALDFDDKQTRLATNLRASLTVTQLLKFIDQPHQETVGVLSLLRTLVEYIPELNKYSTNAAKIPLNPAGYRVHPLGSKLKDALLDFLGQVGQDYAHSNRRLTLCIGDGLTYERILQSLAVVEPVLAPWHTAWADLSRIFSTHWGSLVTKDPSKLGFSAAKLHRRAPSNLKKPDFNQGFEILETTHDAHILDCFRIPSFEDLKRDAEQVYHMFCTHLAGERAVEPRADDVSLVATLSSSAHSPTTIPQSLSTDSHSSSAATTSVPIRGEALDDAPIASALIDSSGTQLLAPTMTPESPVAAQKTTRARKKAKKALVPFLGDRVLADSINFLREGIVLREMIYAIAEGDVGRIYEAMKVMLFTFAGSPGSRYPNYLLTFITALELESSIDLRHSILASLVVNLKGQPGKFTAADLVEEYFNRLLQAIAERKGAEYNTKFMRHTVSRNLYHLSRLCNDMNESVGLAMRSGRHTAPRRLADIRILTDEFRRQQLHLRRPATTTSTAPVSSAVCDDESDDSDEDLPATAEELIQSLDNGIPTWELQDGKLVHDEINIDDEAVRMLEGTDDPTLVDDGLVNVASNGEASCADDM